MMKAASQRKFDIRKRRTGPAKVFVLPYTAQPEPIRKTSNPMPSGSATVYRSQGQ
jgi:hypothetical protein